MSTARGEYLTPESTAASTSSLPLDTGQYSLLHKHNVIESESESQYLTACFLDEPVKCFLAAYSKYQTLKGILEVMLPSHDSKGCTDVGEPGPSIDTFWQLYCSFTSSLTSSPSSITHTHGFVKIKELEEPMDE